MNTVLRAILRMTVYRLMPRSKWTIALFGAVALVMLVMANGAKAAETVIVKAADESVTSNVVPQNDDELFFTTTLGVVYRLDMFVIYDSPLGGGIPDLRMNLGEDATGRGWLSYLILNNADTSLIEQLVTSSTGQDYAGGSAATRRVAHVRGTIIGGGGIWRLRWAQFFTNVNPFYVRAGSVLRYSPITDPAPSTSFAWGDVTGKPDFPTLYCDADGTEVDTDCASGGTSGVTQEDFDAYVLASHTCGDPNADPPQPACEVEFAPGGESSNTGKLQWYGIWGIVGLLLVLMIAPLFLRLLDPTRGM